MQSDEKVAPSANDGKLRWRRGTFTIRLEPWAVAAGRSNQKEGWICEPFAIHTNELGVVVLTHLPSGAAIGSSSVECVGNTEAKAKKFAAKLMALSATHWFEHKRKQGEKIATTRRSAWWRRANEMFQAVYAETHP